MHTLHFNPRVNILDTAIHHTGTQHNFCATSTSKLTLRSSRTFHSHFTSHHVHSCKIVFVPFISFHATFQVTKIDKLAVGVKSSTKYMPRNNLLGESS